ncbi:unnamed protein product, partial [Urochloa humidicola]
RNISTFSPSHRTNRRRRTRRRRRRQRGGRLRTGFRAFPPRCPRRSGPCRRRRHPHAHPPRATAPVPPSALPHLVSPSAPPPTLNAASPPFVPLAGQPRRRSARAAPTTHRGCRGCQPVPRRAINPGERWLAQAAGELPAVAASAAAAVLLVATTPRPQTAWRCWSSLPHPPLHCSHGHHLEPQRGDGPSAPPSSGLCRFCSPVNPRHLQRLPFLQLPR